MKILGKTRKQKIIIIISLIIVAIPLFFVAIIIGVFVNFSLQNSRDSNKLSKESDLTIQQSNTRTELVAKDCHNVELAEECSLYLNVENGARDLVKSFSSQGYKFTDVNKKGYDGPGQTVYKGVNNNKKIEAIIIEYENGPKKVFQYENVNVRIVYKIHNS